MDTTPPELNKPADKIYDPCDPYTAPVVVARDAVDGDLTAFAQSYYYSAAVVASGNGRCPNSGTSAQVDTVYVTAEHTPNTVADGVEEGRRSNLTLTSSLAPPPPSTAASYLPPLVCPPPPVHPSCARSTRTPGMYCTEWCSVDSSGNEGCVSHFVTVNDPGAPYLEISPATESLECNVDQPELGTLVDFHVQFDCLNPPAVTHTDLGTVKFATKGKYEIVYEVDPYFINGPKSTTTQTFTVVDNRDPVITCPEDTQVIVGDVDVAVAMAPPLTTVATAAPAFVTCKLTVDNHLDTVKYNDVVLTPTNGDASRGWDITKIYSFTTVPGARLDVVGREDGHGGTCLGTQCSGFAMECQDLDGGAWDKFASTTDGSCKISKVSDGTAYVPAVTGSGFSLKDSFGTGHEKIWGAGAQHNEWILFSCKPITP